MLFVRFDAAKVQRKNHSHKKYSFKMLFVRFDAAKVQRKNHSHKKALFGEIVTK